MQATSICLFFIASCLLLSVAEASAARLYEIDLLRQSPVQKVDALWSSDSRIVEAQQEIRKDPTRKNQFLFDIASVKALQGKLVEALEDLATIDDDYLKATPEFLEERAEIKSLLGFDDAALNDINRIPRRFQNWKTLWHRSLIFARAGRNAESMLDFRKALAQAERFKTGDNYLTTLLESAKSRNIAALEPDPQKREKALAVIESLMNLSSAPALSDTVRLLGIETQAFDPNSAGENFHYPSSTDSPVTFATISSNAHQIRVSFDDAACMITPEIIRKQFDAATEQELYPGGMGGCANGALTLYPKHQNGSVCQFIFDGAQKPALKEFFICYKEKSALAK